MNTRLERGRTSLLPIAGAALSLMLFAAGFTFNVRSSAAQTADTDGDGYADGVEQQLGSNPNDPESTPESFTLLWTCTDGNDNDRDGKRDLMDPGCRNTVPGSTPAPAATPAPNGASDSGTNPGGPTNGSPDGGGNAVLEGAGAPISGTSGSAAGSDAASQTGQNSGDTTGAHSEKSADAGAAPGTDTASRDTTGDNGGGFPWKISLLFLVLLLLAGLIAAGALAARSRRLAARNRY